MPLEHGLAVHLGFLIPLSQCGLGWDEQAATPGAAHTAHNSTQSTPLHSELPCSAVFARCHGIPGKQEQKANKVLRWLRSATGCWNNCAGAPASACFESPCNFLLKPYLTRWNGPHRAPPNQQIIYLRIDCKLTKLLPLLLNTIAQLSMQFALNTLPKIQLCTPWMYFLCAQSLCRAQHVGSARWLWVCTVLSYWTRCAPGSTCRLLS